MFFKKIKWFYLSFIPPLLLSTDFLPQWFIYYNCFLLTILSLIKLPNLLSYLNFISIYFIFSTVELRIIPETAVPSLGVFIISQLILSKSIKSDAYLLFLWCGAFAIFNPTLYYLCYIISCLFIMYKVLETSQGSLLSSFKTFYKYKVQLFLGLLFTLFLFIFFPRFYNFLPTSNSVPKGQVGYSKEINNSEISEISLSNQTAFFVETDKIIEKNKMYWRGRVLDTTQDGYNWKSKQPPPLKSNLPKEMKDTITYRIKYEQNFDEDIILLDTPLSARSLNGRIYKIESTNTYKTYVKQKKVSVEAVSHTEYNLNQVLSRNLKSHFLKIPEIKSPLFENFVEQVKASKASEVIKNFENKILTDKYEYTLAPGVMPTLASFIQNKKGYCTHYAALLTTVLRHLEIPARIITGFQGGKYNDLGEFYEVKSNDAHAWIEYYDQGSWKRIDPTSFIAPDRIRRGGEDFLTKSSTSQNTNMFLAGLTRIKLFVETMNYQFSLLVENFDREKQKSISDIFNIDLKTFFKIGFFIGGAILVIFYIYIGRAKKVYLSKEDQLLVHFEKKLLKLKLIKSQLSIQKTIQAMKEQVLRSNYQEEIINFISLYEVSKYGNEKKYNELKSISEKKFF